MDGISNVAGNRTRQITIDGNRYTLSPMILDEYAERERYILSLKPHPLTVIESAPPLPAAPVTPVPPDPSCSPAERKAYSTALANYVTQKAKYDSAILSRSQFIREMRDEAMKPQIVSMAEDAAFDQSLHGIGYRFWRALRDHHPEIDGVQAALQLLEKAGSSRLSEIRSAIDGSEEKDILKNSAAPAVNPDRPDASPGG